jgi:hypothetical protein
MQYKVGNIQYNVRRHTDEFSSSALTVSGAGVFYGVLVCTDGVNDITLNVYDGLTASGSKLLPSDVVVAGWTNLVSIYSDNGLVVDNGIYVSAVTSGTYTFQVYYDVA